MVAHSSLRGQVRAFAAKADTNLRPPGGHGIVAESCAVDGHPVGVTVAAARSRWVGGERLRSSTDERMSKKRATHSTRLLTTREAAAQLGVHERTLRRYMSSGLLSYRRLPGGHYRIPEESIRQLWDGEDSLKLDGRRRPLATGDPSVYVRYAGGGTRIPCPGRRSADEGAVAYDLSPETLAELSAQAVGNG